MRKPINYLRKIFQRNVIKRSETTSTSQNNDNVKVGGGANIISPTRNEKRTLFICETYDYENFTRRATIDAIGEQSSDIDAAIVTGVWNKSKVDAKSKKINILSLYYYCPQSVRKYWPSLFYSIIRYNLRATIRGYENIVITSPNQEYLIDVFKGKTFLFLISDPYHLMGVNDDASILLNVNRIANFSKIILCTSIALAGEYLETYVPAGKGKEAVYWPNCVDVELWKFDTPLKITYDSDKIVFVGNFMNITDLNLLAFIIDHLVDVEIHIYGKITYSECEFSSRVLELMQKPNVHNHGYVTSQILVDEVSVYSVGLLLDDINNPLSRFHHHNKVYQYLALGIPVVSMKYLPDYDNLVAGVFLSDTYVEYVENVKGLLSGAIKYRKDRLHALAYDNSSSIRAKQFLNLVDGI